MASGGLIAVGLAGRPASGEGAKRLVLTVPGRAAARHSIAVSATASEAVANSLYASGKGPGPLVRLVFAPGPDACCAATRLRLTGTETITAFAEMRDGTREAVQATVTVQTPD